MPDACFRCHVDDIEILATRVCLVAQQSTQSMSLFSEREKKCGTQQRQQQTNNHTSGGLENFLRHPLEKTNYSYIADTQGRERRTNVVSEFVG